MVLHHRIEWRGGRPARAVDVLGTGPVRCTVGVVSVSREPVGRGRHGGVCVRSRGAAMGGRAPRVRHRGDESLEGWLLAKAGLASAISDIVKVTAARPATPPSARSA